MTKPKWWWSRTRFLQWRVEWLEDVVRHLVRLQEQQSRNLGAVVEADMKLAQTVDQIVRTLYHTKAKDDVPISH